MTNQDAKAPIENVVSEKQKGQRPKLKGKAIPKIDNNTGRLYFEIVLWEQA